MSPRAIARKLAAIYRADPTKWRRGVMGSVASGCCIMGGAIDLIGSQPWYARTSSELEFSMAFRRATGWMPVAFNDHLGRTVGEVIEALERVK